MMKSLILLLITSISIQAQVGSSLGLQNYIGRNFDTTKAVTARQIDSLYQLQPNSDTLRLLSFCSDTNHTTNSIIVALKSEIKEKQTIFAYNLLINELGRNENQDSTKKYITQLLSIDKNNFHGRKNKAKALLIDGDSPRALAYLNSLEKEKPSSVEILTLKGSAYQEMNRTSSAALNYEKAIALDSSYVPALSGLLSIYVNLQEYQAGLKIGRKIVKLYPTYYQARIELAVCYLNLNQTDSAISNLNKVYQTNPEDPNVNQFLMLSYHSKEDMDSLCKYKNSYKKTLATVQDGPKYIEEIENHYGGYCIDTIAEYYYQRGIACFNKNEFENAIDWYNDGLRKFPINFYTWQFKGNAHMMLKQYEEAIVAYQNSIDHFAKNNIKIPDHLKDQKLALLAMSYFSMAECYAHIRKNVLALETIKKFESSYGAAPLISIPAKNQTLATVAINRNKYNEAYSHLYNTYQIALNNGGGMQEGLQLVGFIQELHFNNPSKFYIVTVGYTNPNSILHRKSGSFQLKRESLHTISIDQAFLILDELLSRFPDRANLIIAKAYLNKVLGNSYCDDIKTIQHLGYPILEDPYWEHCKN